MSAPLNDGPPQGRQVHLLVGGALDHAVGSVVACPRRPSAIRDALVSRQREDSPDQWAILGRFEGNRRSRTTWQCASGLTLDLDWEDPTLPRDEGAHQATPIVERDRILKALREYPVPGLAYLTPRGLRVMHVLAEDIDLEETYANLVESAGEKLLRHLSECGVRLWRDGVTGLRLDSASRSPWQAMRGPLYGQPIVLTGGDYVVCVTAFEECGGQRMDLDAALPPEVAGACRQIGAWAQVAVEVVVTGLMALVSAAIGNTRWVVVRGRAIPLSLHYLTSLLAGSGKGTVRSFLRKATEDIERAVSLQREKAQRERQEYRDRLDEWRSDGRSKKAREERGPRPEPPAMSWRGGERTSFIVSEANLEGIIATLEDTPRGFLWASDEAHEIVGMLGRYGDGRAARSLDAARVRCLMDSTPVEAHRARSNNSSVRRLPRPWLAMDADVQPSVLQTLFSKEDRGSGLTARFLMHAPPSMQGQRRYVDAPPEPDAGVLDLLRVRLWALWAHEQALDDGVPAYQALPLDVEAEQLWAEELERLERRYPAAGEEESGALGHARGRLLRLAGVLTLLRDPEAKSVTAEDMRRAVVHMRYHLEHHRALMAQAEEGVEADRIERLREQTTRIVECQSKVGVRASDLQRHISKSRYGGKQGLQRAYADLHRLGWNLRRPARPKGRAGRPPVAAFFPPESEVRVQPRPASPPHKPHKPAEGGLGGLGDERPSGGAHTHDAVELLDQASARLLGTSAVELPPPGVRAACPACGSPDGLGVLPDDPERWYCHSDRHGGARSGCAVDYLLAARLERMPSVSEAVAEAKRILGEPVARAAEAEPPSRGANARERELSDDADAGQDEAFFQLLLETFDGVEVPVDDSATTLLRRPSARSREGRR